MNIVRPATLALLAGLVACALGCRDREIQAYRAPKDPPPSLPNAPVEGTNNLPTGHPPVDGVAADPGSAMAQTPVPTAEGSDLQWTAPADWKPKAGSAMRKGSYAVAAEGDLSITAFPGDTGGLAANLNRWRSQVSLPAEETPALLADAEKFNSNGLDFVVVNYAGGGRRLLGAVATYGGNTWFFKLTGPDALVAAQKGAFDAFLRTVRAP